MKLLVLYSDEGYNPCSLRREPFLPNLTVKETYKTLIRPLVKQPTAQKSTESVLQRNDIDWATVYLLPQKTTIESRMHIFQYKILNNILYLNNRLYKFGYVQSLLCSLCNSETETMIHLFCHCSKTLQLWSSLSNWYKEFLALLTLEPSTAILGFWNINDKKANSLTIFLYYLNISFMQIEIYSMQQTSTHLSYSSAQYKK